jgi:hypothetical protein
MLIIPCHSVFYPSGPSQITKHVVLVTDVYTVTGINYTAPYGAKSKVAAVYLNDDVSLLYQNGTNTDTDAVRLVEIQAPRSNDVSSSWGDFIPSRRRSLDFDATFRGLDSPL